MLTLAGDHGRLEISRDEHFANVSESIRALLQICHVNGLRGALIVSRQGALDWRSSLRIGIRFAVSRAELQGLRLALVAGHFNDAAHEDVLVVAREAKLECRIFREEAEAIAWLASAGTAPGPAGPRR